MWHCAGVCSLGVLGSLSSSAHCLLAGNDDHLGGMRHPTEKLWKTWPERSESHRNLGYTFAICCHLICHCVSLHFTWTLKEEKDAVMTCMLQRNTTIPTKRSKLFTTCNAGQESVCIKVLEGELPLAKDNHIVGDFQLKGISPAAKDRTGGDIFLIEITFDIDVPWLKSQGLIAFRCL